MSDVAFRTAPTNWWAFLLLLRHNVECNRNVLFSVLLYYYIKHLQNVFTFSVTTSRQYKQFDTAPQTFAPTNQKLVLFLDF